MSIEAHRWLMTAVDTPLERAAFRAEPGPGEVVVAVEVHVIHGLETYTFGSERWDGVFDGFSLEPGKSD